MLASKGALMSFWHNPACLMFAFTCMACGLTGCREVDPQPNLYVDLGEGDQRLLPTVSQPRDPRVKTGQAEFKAFLSPADKAGAPILTRKTPTMKYYLKSAR
jgi:hypothetical protein